MITLQPHQYIAHLDIIRVVDADTYEFTAMKLGHRVSIEMAQLRLQGVDAPESRLAAANDKSKDMIAEHVAVGRRVKQMAIGITNKHIFASVDKSYAYALSDKQLPRQSYGARFEGDLLLFNARSMETPFSMRKFLLAYELGFATNDARHAWTARELLAVDKTLAELEARFAESGFRGLGRRAFL